ncbi:zinc ribbon domain-containing protein [Candidatus Palauibacter sp.]|uniref:zinc ribbon domain-containing protein n=1 Tax=Candidatus Palauibacter sp. TaxID=3101350 RepID=UPI003B02A588
MQASDTVGELLTLQEIDLEILRIEDELERLDEEVAGLRDTVQALETRVDGIRGEARKAEARVDRFRRSVEAGRATLKRLESKATAVVNEQQYLALRSETETARRNLRAAEDDQLDAMLEVESAREALGKVEAELEEAATTLAARAAAADDLRARLERELLVRGADRKDQEDRLDRRTLELYKTAGGGGRRSALAELTVDGVCGRCFTSVPKQRQAEIRTRRDLAVCEGCGIILYPVSSGA